MERGIGYKVNHSGLLTEYINTSYAGTPESQGYTSVWMSNNPKALAWCRNTLMDRKSEHEAKVAGLNRELENIENRINALKQRHNK